MALKLPRLPSGFKIINKDGSATNDFQIWWQNVAGQTEAAINGIQAALEAAGIALDAADAAQAAADAAQAAADAAQTAADNAQNGNAATQSEQSLINSGVINEAGNLQATAAGTIIIANHERRYGDPTLNPTVAVTGDSVGSSFTSGDYVYAYYIDPSRGGGAVTYLLSLDPADAVQGNNVHSVGAALVPMAGSNDGTYTRPPGIPA